MKKVYVVCPANFVSGGPELLHQFVDCLNDFGTEAYILYHPFDTTHETPTQFRKYNTPVGNFEDVKDNIIVLSEVHTRLIDFFPDASVQIWWASVDFYLGVNRETLIGDFFRFARSILFRRKPIRSLRKYNHWVQSEYARQFLARRGIRSAPLRDYLNSSHSAIKAHHTKGDVIAYNPKKGRRRTASLIRRYPDYTFVPIENLSAEGVQLLLAQAKVYIDFGQHPGKDRLPREAALAGCCIITGRRGSASNNIDIPIPEMYKLDDRSSKYINKFGELIKKIFDDYELHSKDFDEYRRSIEAEKSDFIRDVKDFINFSR